MEKYNFDQIIDRRGTNCLKYDFAVERGKDADVLPLWVADMDFQVADGIRERLHQSVEHGIFGYSESKEDYYQAVAGWYRENFSWEPKKSWLVKTPGVVFAIAMAVQAYTKPGDGVLIQQPVYYPFSEVIKDNGRNIVNSPLVLRDGRYEMDFEDFEKKMVENKVKLFLLCSPHNPVGRVWDKAELERVGEICLRHHVIVFSDEIHSDFTYGKKHFVFSSLRPEFEKISIVATAPSKTFNIASLQVSNVWIADEKLRNAFKRVKSSAGYSQLNGLGLVACQAAYETGRDWLDQVKLYIKENLDFTREYLEEHLPKLRLIEPEGTYLIWIDFRALGLSEEEREELICKKAKLWLDSGAIFGADGEGFERINIACPRSVLKEALDRLREVFGNL